MEDTSQQEIDLPLSVAARVRSQIVRRGFVGAIRRFLFVLRRQVFRNWEPPHPFDAAHGVATGGLLTQIELETGHDHDLHTTAYHGTQPSIFRGGLERWRAAIIRSAKSVEEFTFVDIGCGKGRVLMLASEFPFRRVVGLELNAKVASSARENIRQWRERPRACKQIEVLTGDVLAFALPPEPTLLYMYNPFEGDLFRLWVQTLAFALRERMEPLYLLYTYPRYEAMLALLPGAKLLWTAELRLDRDEMITDRFGCVTEQVSLYLLAASAGTPSQ